MTYLAEIRNFFLHIVFDLPLPFRVVHICVKHSKAHQPRQVVYHCHRNAILAYSKYNSYLNDQRK